MNSSRLLIAALMILLVQTAGAQVMLPEKLHDRNLGENVFGLGLFGGPASGLGLSFRHHLPTAFSYQITGGIIKVDDRLSYDIGGEAQFDLGRGQTSRVFVAAGASYFYTGKTSKNDMDGPGRVGLGIGGEMVAGTSLHATVELLFTYFTDGTVLPLPQFGFFYYFY